MGKNLNIAVLWLLDYDGSHIRTGGLERWCRDIALLSRDKGYQVTIYQKATVPFEKWIAEGVRVIGVKCSLRITGNWRFSRWLERNTDVRDPFIFVWQELALSRKIHRAVGVNHGISWNGDKAWYKKLINRRLHYDLITRLRGVICVDTNYINWCHAEFPNRSTWAQKLFYVPNYADLEKFPLVCRPRTPRAQPIILFPRRVAGMSIARNGRGAGLLLDAFELLDREGVKARIVFAGRGALQSEIQAWASEHGFKDRITVTELPLDDMARLYAEADVIVIPSIEEEGTSFSAVEGLVSGKPVVVSHIGGLGNIVINGLNGYMCDLSPRSLADSIRRALEAPLFEPDSAVVEACRRSFAKERWEQQVWGHISRCLRMD